MVLQGKIIKLLGGFYYVQNKEGTVEETRARGVFRHQDIKPIVGDNVLYSYGQGQELSYIEEILTRKNHLIRPPVANVDQVLLFIPVKSPKYNLFLVDKLIAYYESLNIDIIILISKSDLGQKDAMDLFSIYERSGFASYCISERDPNSYRDLRKKLENKTTALSGVSGAGKSTFTNLLLNKDLLTQEVSKKTNRGRHTTRHTELMSGGEGIFLFDTPGFSSMDLTNVKSGELGQYFREFAQFTDQCQFMDCKHINEKQCGVISAYEDRKIEESRYKNYQRMFEDLVKKEKDKWR